MTVLMFNFEKHCSQAPPQNYHCPVGSMCTMVGVGLYHSNVFRNTVRPSTHLTSTRQDPAQTPIPFVVVDEYAFQAQSPRGQSFASGCNAINARGADQGATRHHPVHGYGVF